MSINPLDELSEQIDINETIKTCDKCLHHSNFLFNLSCIHIICMECLQIAITNNNANYCPVCQHSLLNNLMMISNKFLNNLVSRLGYYHNININNTVWAYSGINHNWLYTSEQCKQINSAFNNSLSKLKICINDDTYIINFDTLTQYSEKKPTAKRKIFSFKFNSLSDLKKNKIIGVAGKYL